MVDDSLQCGAQEFWDITLQTLDQFGFKERVTEWIAFAGIHVDKKIYGFLLRHGEYMRKLSKLEKKASFSIFRSTCARLSWLCNTSPDIACAVAKPAQVTEGQYNKEEVLAINKVLLHISKSSDNGIEMPKLDLDNTSLVVFPADGLAGNCDLSRHIGFLITRVDE